MFTGVSSTFGHCPATTFHRRLLTLLLTPLAHFYALPPRGPVDIQARVKPYENTTAHNLFRSVFDRVQCEGRIALTIRGSRTCRHSAEGNEGTKSATQKTESGRRQSGLRTCS